MQVGPLVGRAVQPDGQVLQALGSFYLLHRVLHDRLGVLELDGRHEFLQIAGRSIPLVAGLGDRQQKRIDGIAPFCRGLFVRGVGEISRAH